MKTIALSLAAAVLGFGLTVGALAAGTPSAPSRQPVPSSQAPVMLPTVVVRPSPEDLADARIVVLPTVVVRPARTDRTPSVYAGSTAWSQD